MDVIEKVALTFFDSVLRVSLREKGKRWSRGLLNILHSVLEREIDNQNEARRRRKCTEVRKETPKKRKEAIDKAFDAKISKRQMYRLRPF
jgi:hypothetical protein